MWPFNTFSRSLRRDAKAAQRGAGRRSRRRTSASLSCELLERRTLLSNNLSGACPDCDLENAALKALITEAASAGGLNLPAETLIEVLINKVGVGWHYVDPGHPFQSVTGQVVTHDDEDFGVSGSQVSYTDLPATHLSHDLNMI